MNPPTRRGLLSANNCAITEEKLESIIRRDQQIGDHYELERDYFARGRFSQVRLARSKTSGAVFAAKIIKRHRSRHGDVTSEIIHEICVLLTARPCTLIVNVHEVFESATEFTLILELAQGGELQQIIDNQEPIDESICRKILRQLVGAVRFLHSHQIAHLDIKPQNILLTSPLPHGEVKLCDFGIARVIDDKFEIRDIMGTIDYMPPEILKYEPLSLTSDIWSIGIVAYVLLSGGYTPFGADNRMETFWNITCAPLEFPDHLFENVSPQAKDFITRCVVHDPAKRMTSEECLQHEWLCFAELK